MLSTDIQEANVEEFEGEVNFPYYQPKSIEGTLWNSTKFLPEYDVDVMVRLKDGSEHFAVFDSRYPTNKFRNGYYFNDYDNTIQTEEEFYDEDVIAWKYLVNHTTPSVFILPPLKEGLEKILQRGLDEIAKDDVEDYEEVMTKLYSRAEEFKSGEGIQKLKMFLLSEQ